MPFGSMSFEVVKHGNNWVCREKGGSKVFGSHKTKHEAMAQLRALYAGQRRSGGGKSADFDDPGELLVMTGGSVKALDGEGHIGGYLIRFGSPEQHDSSPERDYFTAETDLGRFARGELDLLFHHGLPAVKGQPNDLAETVIGSATLRPDDVGWWLDGRLDLAVPGVEGRWTAMKADDDAFGLSSGAVRHRVKRVQQDNGSHWLARWPVAEASVTPDPAERLTAAVALKSLVDDSDAELWIDACLKAVSDLRDDVARFVKIGPAKRDAVRELRDSLNLVLTASAPFDRTDILRRKAEIDSLIARYA